MIQSNISFHLCLGISSVFFFSNCRMPTTSIAAFKIERSQSVSTVSRKTIIHLALQKNIILKYGQYFLRLFSTLPVTVRIKF
jgi:hypothetical protein